MMDARRAAAVAAPRVAQPPQVAARSTRRTLWQTHKAEWRKRLPLVQQGMHFEETILSDEQRAKVKKYVGEDQF